MKYGWAMDIPCGTGPITILGPSILISLRPLGRVSKAVAKVDGKAAAGVVGRCPPRRPARPTRTDPFPPTHLPAGPPAHWTEAVGQNKMPPKEEGAVLC